MLDRESARPFEEHSTTKSIVASRAVTPTSKQRLMPKTKPRSLPDSEKWQGYASETHYSQRYHPTRARICLIYRRIRKAHITLMLLLDQPMPHRPTQGRCRVTYHPLALQSTATLIIPHCRTFRPMKDRNDSIVRERLLAPSGEVRRQTISEGSGN